MLIGVELTLLTALCCALLCSKGASGLRTPGAESQLKKYIDLMLKDLTISYAGAYGNFNIILEKFHANFFGIRLGPALRGSLRYFSAHTCPPPYWT